jgi:hypothetical protein
MRQFTTVSISPWANPYNGDVGAGQNFYGSSGKPQQPAYRRIVLPPAPVFYHAGVEQMIEDGGDDVEDDEDSGMCGSLTARMLESKSNST